VVDVHDDQAINRWMKRGESGEIIGMIALEGLTVKVLVRRPAMLPPYTPPGRLS
jgi:hypothetical protein